MIGQAGSGRASARRSGQWVDTHPTPEDDAREDRAILSFTLLISVIAAGFVISLSLAETNPLLTALFSTLTN